MLDRAAAALDRVPPKHSADWRLRIDGRDNRTEGAQPPLGRVMTLAPRGMLFDEGDLAKSCFEIASGTIMLAKLLPDGRRQIIELLGPGDMLGFTACGRHDACAEAMTLATVIVYDRAMLRSSPQLMERVNERLQEQICGLHDHAILLGRKSALERVATFLMRLTPKRGGPGCLGRCGRSADEATVTVSLTRQEIADYLGLTLETVSRAFSALKRQGLIRSGQHDAVTITDVCALCRVAAAG